MFLFGICCNQKCLRALYRNPPDANPNMAAAPRVCHLLSRAHVFLFFQSQNKKFLVLLKKSFGVKQLYDINHSDKNVTNSSVFS